MRMAHLRQRRKTWPSWGLIALFTFVALQPSVVLSSVASYLHADIVSSTSVPASGKGTASVVVRILRGGSPLAKKSHVRAVILSGDARFVSGSASVDLRTDSASEIRLALLPGTKAGPLSIRLSSEGESSTVQMMLTSVARPAIVVGFATGGIGPVPGWIEAPDAANNGTTARRGTISLYGTGKIAKNTRGTFAYDSADTLSQSLSTGPFLDNPNDRPFPIYGDTSIRYDDALSTNHFFGRVQNGHTSAMWGEFYARSPATSVGGYTVLVNGANLTAGSDTLRFNGFTSRNNTAFGRATISPTGLAIASQFLHPDIVVGSDVVQLLHLDRRSGAILSETQLVRGTDYVLDYASGLLRFTNIILPYDDMFNPQVVSVQYQYGGAGAHSTMLGAGMDFHFSKTARLSGWYLNNPDGAGALTFVGQSLSGSSKFSTWSIAHERSSGTMTAAATSYGLSGDSYKLAYALSRGRVNAGLDFVDTTAGYVNPYGTYSIPGLIDARGHLAFQMSRTTELRFAYLYARNMLPAVALSDAVNNSDTEVSATLRVAATKRFAYHVGVEAGAASSNGVPNPALVLSPTTIGSGQNSFFPPLLTAVAYPVGSGHAINATYGFAWQFAPRASLIASRTSPLGGASIDPFNPPQTQAELNVDVGKQGKLFLRQLWQRNSLQPLAGSQVIQTYAATAQSSTTVGFDQTIGAATFESGYAVDHTVNGTDLFSAMGVRGRVYSSKRLTADAFLQVGQQLYTTAPSPGSSSPYFLAGGASLDYTEKTFHATGQIQSRTGYNAGSTVQLGAAGPISPAVALFGTYTGSYTSYVRDSETRVGLSYRPVRNDRYVTLFSLDSQQSNLTNYNAYVTNVAQIQELYRPGRRTELAGSLAYKLTGDSFFAPGTSILGLRANQRIGSRFDLGTEVHFSNIAPLVGTSATGFALEGGYRLGSTLRLAVGYNFSGFANPAASVNPTHRGIYVTFSSYIDRIFGWGKDAH